MADLTGRISFSAIKRLFSGASEKNRARKNQNFSNLIAHLSSRETYNRKYVDDFLVFYKKKPENKLFFFSLLAGAEQYIVYALLNKLFALTDTPRLILSLRIDLRNFLRQSREKKRKEEIDTLKRLDSLFCNYLESIFSYQYLELSEHNADNTPLNLLKFIAEKEGVHPASHFVNFENRLNSPDRLVLSLSHFKLKKAPIVYIEVALTGKIPRRLSEILSENRVPEKPEACSAAAFYSVNKCIKGLDGVGLGEKMIIKAAEYLKNKYPWLEHFVTLSPVPSFSAYLAGIAGAGGSFTGTPEGEILGSIINRKDDIFLTGYIKSKYGVAARDAGDVLKYMLSSTAWKDDDVLKRKMKRAVYELCREYLLNRKKNTAGGETAYDPVENFHLNNGAELLYINPFANNSERGIGESLGVMVNYRYKLEKIETNRERYHSGRIIHHV